MQFLTVCNLYFIILLIVVAVVFVYFVIQEIRKDKKLGHDTIIYPWESEQ